MTCARLIRSPSNAVAILLLTLLLGLPWLDAVLNLLPDPFDISFETFEGPSVSHPLGTSDGGTDILSELSAGLRRSCAFGLLTAASGTALAFFAGLLGAALPRCPRRLVERTADVILAVPPVLPLIALSAAAMPPAWINALILAALLWAPPSKFILTAALTEADSGWVAASRRFGAGPLLVMRRHLLPAVAPLVPVVALSIFRRAVFTEAALGFLGLSDPAVRTLGGMIAKTLQFYYLPDVWLRWLLPPVLCLSALMFCAMTLAARTGAGPLEGERP